MPEREIKKKRVRPRLFNLRKAMFVLPNLFTLSSIFCGFYAIVLTSGDPGPQQFYQATLAVFFGLFFDGADGRVARLTKTQSDFGVQLDSLADVITFGLAPAVIVHKWALSSLGIFGILGAFTFASCGALRLARFNVLAQRGLGSKSHFVGLPIPLAAAVLTSLVMFHQVTIPAHVVHEAHILALVLVLSYLMVSNVRYRSFKDLKLSKKSLTVGLLFIALFVVMAVRVTPSFALLAFFGGYVLFGLGEAVARFRLRRDDKKTPPSDGSQKPEVRR